MNKKVMTKLGKRQYLFYNGYSYPVTEIEDIRVLISCDAPKISEVGGMGFISILNEDGDVSLKLSTEKGNSLLSVDRGAIILVDGMRGGISSQCFYGVEESVDFAPDSNTFSLNSAEEYVEALRSFCSFWHVPDDFRVEIIIVVDRFDVFRGLRESGHFKDCVVLMAEN